MLFELFVIAYVVGAALGAVSLIEMVGLRLLRIWLNKPARIARESSADRGPINL
jgi:hypothetical protein